MCKTTCRFMLCLITQCCLCYWCLEAWLRFPLASCFLIAAACLAMWTKCVWNVPLQGLEPYRPILKILLRLLTGGALLCAAGFWWFWRRISPRDLSNIVLGGFAALAGVVIVFYYRTNMLTGSMQTVQWLVYMISAVCCGAFIIFTLRSWRLPDGNRSAWR